MKNRISFKMPKDRLEYTESYRFDLKFMSSLMEREKLPKLLEMKDLVKSYYDCKNDQVGTIIEMLINNDFLEIVKDFYWITSHAITECKIHGIYVPPENYACEFDMNSEFYSRLGQVKDMPIMEFVILVNREFNCVFQYQLDEVLKYLSDNELIINSDEN